MSKLLKIGVFRTASAIHAATRDIVRNIGPRFSVEELFSRPPGGDTLAIVDADVVNLAHAVGCLKGAAALLGVETSVLKNLVQHPQEAAELHTTLANLAHVIAQKPNPFTEFGVESTVDNADDDGVDDETDDREK